MNVYSVLYTEDFEPITVLELTPRVAAMIQERGSILLQVHEPLSIERVCRDGGLAKQEFKTVHIWAEHFVRKEQKTLMLFTRDDENAMLLRAAFLPGQRASLQQERSKAFAQGFMRALQTLGDA